MGFATQPCSVIVIVHPACPELVEGASGAMATVHVPPNIFSVSLTRDTSRHGGSLSTMSVGTSEALIAWVMAGHTSTGACFTRSVRLAVWVRGSIEPMIAMTAARTTR